MEHPCFLLPPPERCARYLRRWTSAEAIGVRLCEPLGYHSAMVCVGDGLLMTTPNGWLPDPCEWNPDDDRWPTKCDYCDYEWVGERGGQLFFSPLFDMPDDSDVIFMDCELEGCKRAPVGAMYVTEWDDEPTGPDGKQLAIMTPGGVWYVDKPMVSGQRWKRIGNLPRISITPGVVMANGYQGHVYQGVLIDGGT